MVINFVGITSTFSGIAVKPSYKYTPFELSTTFFDKTHHYSTVNNEIRQNLTKSNMIFLIKLNIYELKSTKFEVLTEFNEFDEFRRIDKFRPTND